MIRRFLEKSNQNDHPFTKSFNFGQKQRTTTSVSFVKPNTGRKAKIPQKKGTQAKKWKFITQNDDPNYQKAASKAKTGSILLETGTDIIKARKPAGTLASGKEDRSKFPLQLILREVLITNDTSSSTSVSSGELASLADTYKQLVKYCTIMGFCARSLLLPLYYEIFQIRRHDWFHERLTSTS